MCRARGHEQQLDDAHTPSKGTLSAFPETTLERPASPEQVAGALDRPESPAEVTGLIERLRLPEAALASDGGAGEGEGGAAASGGAADMREALRQASAQPCAQCGIPKPIISGAEMMKKCARCMQVAYCSKE